MALAIFIKDAMSEGKYESSFNDRISDRIDKMNVEQLQGMYDYLKSTAKTSKFSSWKEANTKVIDKIEGVLNVKSQAARQEKKQMEEEQFKIIQAKIKSKEKKREQAQIAASIEKAAFTEAEKQIRQLEEQRQAEEKLVLVQKIFAGEEKRNRWWISTAVISIVLIIAVIIAYAILSLMWYVLVGGIFVVLVAAGVAVYKAYYFPIVEPMEVTEQDLHDQIVSLQQKIKVQNEERNREKDAQFALQLKKEKKEIKKRKLQLKEKERQEAEYLEKARLDRIAALRSSQGLDQQEDSVVRHFNSSDDDEEAARGQVPHTELSSSEKEQRHPLEEV